MAGEQWSRAWFRRVSIGVVVGFAVLAVAACGDDDDDTADATTVETTTTTTGDTITTSATTVSTTTEPEGATVELYFSNEDASDCSVVEAFARSIGDDADPIRAAFDELVGGPTTEEVAGGAGSFFSSETEGVVLSASPNDGLLVVDFTDLRVLIPNASTSCGSEALLAQLTMTAFQFTTVDRVRFSIEGSCDAFANWLQRDCFDTDRAGQQLTVPTNERASGSGCTPQPGDSLPSGRWFGFLVDPQPDEVSFDLACWFGGTAAAAAATEDGEESPPPNDFHIRNDNDRLRTLTVDSSTEVAWLPNPGDPNSLEVVGYEAWRTEQPGRVVTPGVWLNVEGGRAVSIEEQYVP